MPLAFYMDQHVPRAITNGLRLRSLDVLTAHEDGTSTWSDSGVAGINWDMHPRS